MPVQKHDAAEAVRYEVLGEIDQHVKVDARGGGHRAGEVEMVVRIAQPHQRGEQHALMERLSDAAHDLAEQQAVGEQRHVPAVLLQGRDRHNDRRVMRQCRHLRPGHFQQFHGNPPQRVWRMGPASHGRTRYTIRAVQRVYQHFRSAGRPVSSFAIPRLALGLDEVHLWQLRAEQIAEPALLRRFEELLAPEESERHARFGHERTRREYLLARGLARTVLASYTGMATNELRFSADAFGKPVLHTPVANPRLHFNLSHSHGVIVCAAAMGRQVGVDVEYGARHVEFLELAERYFAAAEVAQLRGLFGAERQAAFFAIWTLKEAFVKAIGQGLSFPLDTFAFDLDGDRLVCFNPPPSLPESWRFFQFEPTPEHCGALAVECDGRDVRVEMRDWIDVFSVTTPPSSRRPP